MSELMEFITRVFKQELVEQDKEWQTLQRRKEDEISIAMEACEQGGVSSGELIDMVDAINLLAEYESDTCFVLGMQMGLELGGLDSLRKILAER